MAAMEGPGGWEVPGAVIGAFRFDGTLIGSAPMPGGHIHQTLLVESTGGRYVLQRLNGEVFPDLDLLLSNVERVVAHFRRRGRKGPELVETWGGALSLREEDGTAWRAFRYLEGTVERATPSSPADAFEAARAFADYLVTMADLPGPPLVEAIERFHDLRHRLSALAAATAADPLGRRVGARAEIDRAGRLGWEVVGALDGRAGASPVRTVHNDAKLSNVRFDATSGRATCVIDLDTTMPGHLRHDVGELVRTTTTHAPEDARDGSVVDYDLELLDSLSSGFFASSLELEPSEVDTLALGGPEMAIENAVRFLTDHLSGDRYFAVNRPDQNLDRCRTQLRLTELMLENHAESDACFVRATRRSRSVEPAPPVAG